MEVLLSNYTRRNRKEILASLKACVHPLPPHKKQSPMARLTVAWSESVCKLRAIHVNASSLSLIFVKLIFSLGAGKSAWCSE